MITYKNNKLILICMVFVTTIFSCQKNIDTATTQSEQDIVAKNQAAILQRYGRVSAAFAEQVDFSTTAIAFKNEKGETITQNFGQSFTAPLPSTGYFCGNATCTAGTAGNTILANIRGGIASSTRLIKCDNNLGGSSDVEYTWFVSAPFTINATQGIAGNTEVNTTYTDAFGQTQTYTTALTAANIVQLPTKPICPNKYYKITYKVNDIPNTYFGAATIQAVLSLYNDCQNINNNVALTAFGNMQVNSFNAAPCDRTDRPFFNPGTGPNGEMTVTTINSGLCVLPYFLTAIDGTQLEYRKKTNANSNLWADQGSSSIIQNAAPMFSSGQVPILLNSAGNTLRLPNTNVGSGTWIIRYRNIKTSAGCSQYPILGSPWTSSPTNFEIISL